LSQLVRALVRASSRAGDHGHAPPDIGSLNQVKGLVGKSGDLATAMWDDMRNFGRTAPFSPSGTFHLHNRQLPDPYSSDTQN
jgi:hypothetical protein